jgi:hypothetical protein
MKRKTRGKDGFWNEALELLKAFSTYIIKRAFQFVNMHCPKPQESLIVQRNWRINLWNRVLAASVLIGVVVYSLRLLFK